MHAMKAQSAMEYLMTYGWAILIISVVLAALYATGVFNPNTFAPRAQPGACSVYRPYGPGSTQFISTEGPCNSEEPKFVAQFSGVSYITTPSTNMLKATMPLTLTAWIMVSSTSGTNVIVQEGTAATDESAHIWTSSGTLQVGFYGDNCNTGEPVSAGKWYFVAMNWTGGTSKTMGWTIDGTSGTCAITGTPSILPGTSYIGWDGSAGDEWSGDISNVQIYNTSLSQPGIQAIYKEGIGGPPIKLQNLVGWWPLNGNPTDYSGDNLNGIAANVIYTSSWDSGYVAP